MYIKGDDNTVADALSRYPQKESDLASAERMACHPYCYCDNSDAEVANVTMTISPVMQCVNALSSAAPVQMLKSETKIYKNWLKKWKNTTKQTHGVKNLYQHQKGCQSWLSEMDSGS